MRTIKFRAWDKVEKKFITGWVLDERGVYHSGREFEDYIPQLDLELQQFTGLKDKNGKEIYEGDIGTWKDAEGSLVYEQGVVRWHQGGLWFTFAEDTDRSIGVVHSEWEVIGNIYENPEILKV